MLKTLILTCFIVATVKSQCETVQPDPKEPNRTVCHVEKLTKSDPLEQTQSKQPEYLYIDVGRGQIPRDTFTDLQSRKELWFLGQNITYIQPGAFEHLDQLQNLAITHTRIKTLTKNSFAGVPNLKILSLKGNQIESIEEGAFDGLKNLQQLLLDENRVRRINETTFRGLDALMALNLDDNPIEYVHPKAFDHLRNLTQLTISFASRTVGQEALSWLGNDKKTVHYL